MVDIIRYISMFVIGYALHPFYYLFTIYLLFTLFTIYLTQWGQFIFSVGTIEPLIPVIIYKVRMHNHFTYNSKNITYTYTANNHLFRSHSNQTLDLLFWQDVYAVDHTSLKIGYIYFSKWKIDAPVTFISLT